MSINRKYRIKPCIFNNTFHTEKNSKNQIFHFLKDSKEKNEKNLFLSVNKKKRLQKFLRLENKNSNTEISFINKENMKIFNKTKNIIYKLQNDLEKNSTETVENFFVNVEIEKLPFIQTLEKNIYVNFTKKNIEIKINCCKNSDFPVFIRINPHFTNPEIKVFFNDNYFLNTFTGSKFIIKNEKNIHIKNIVLKIFLNNNKIKDLFVFVKFLKDIMKLKSRCNNLFIYDKESEIFKKNENCFIEWENSEKIKNKNLIKFNKIHIKTKSENVKRIKFFAQKTQIKISEINQNKNKSLKIKFLLRDLLRSKKQKVLSKG